MENQRKKVQTMLNQQPMQKNIRVRKQTKSSNYITTEDCHQDYIVLDFETTGMRAGADKIICVLAIQYINHLEVDRFETLVNPQRHIPLEVTQRTGLSDAEIGSAPIMEEVLGDLVTFIGELPIVIHDSSFEMGFLESLHDFSEVRLPKYTVVDTTKLARKIASQLEDVEKMKRLAFLLGTKQESLSGISDCRATADIYKYCCEVSSEAIES
ncbi:exonuclease domain-containing protein [Sporosarcina aquimarina]|uniref:Exonuclease domain-containing protein n=1 Tax=Sporosarcina aquimarina TaxID=114975 RepID=A0ABU4FVC0_9BACL|nr:exonuclease domain-containing protein [Sporosarcina aquimarina]MDW0108673.1 exonuclease domain-containing protein [Sporosarcina aquimarina]